MAKRVFIIHGWEATPESDFFPWLKKELVKKGFEVSVPLMPDTDAPKINAWVSKIKKEVGSIDEDTYFVGHSIAGLAILHYFETLPRNAKCGGALFIAPWTDLTEYCYETGDDREVARPWIETPVNWKKSKTHTRKFTSIFSRDDPYIPIGEAKVFEEKLGANVIILNGNGHFNEEFNITKLPIAVTELLKLMK